MQLTMELGVDRARLLFQYHYGNCPPFILGLLYPNSANDLTTLQSFLFNFKEKISNPDIKDALVFHSLTLLRFVAENENNSKQEKAVAIAKLLLFNMQEHGLQFNITLPNKINNEIILMAYILEQNQHASVEVFSYATMFYTTRFEKEDKLHLPESTSFNDHQNIPSKTFEIILEKVLQVKDLELFKLLMLNNIFITDDAIIKLLLTTPLEPEIQKALLACIKLKRAIHNYEVGPNRFPINQFQTILESLLTAPNLDATSYKIIEICQEYFEQAKYHIPPRTDIERDNPLNLQKERLLDELIAFSHGAKIISDPKHEEDIRRKNLSQFFQKPTSDRFFSLLNALLDFFKGILHKRNNILKKSCKNEFNTLELPFVITHHDGATTLTNVY